MKRLSFVRSRTILPAIGKTLTTSFPFLRRFSMLPEDPELSEFITYLDNLKNYEKSGIPTGAGTDSDDGFDLGRMRRLMELLGNPQSKFKAVHIAGTKGKGSTAAFLSNILRAEGYSVGCYTSPHILTIRERISVGRLCEPVSAKALNSHFQGIKGILDKAVKLENGYISHFEVLTAVAFRIFADENIDVAVIEAGLGGARDATNIISSSGLAASVITTIDEEHLDALGGSLESIAMAKSGIIKNGCSVRVELDWLTGFKFQLVLGGPFLSRIEHILRSKAVLMGSPVVSASDPGNRSIIKGISYIHGKPCQSCDVVLRIEKDIKLFLELFNVNLCMLGPHQLQNAATATCTALCLRHQGWRVSDEAIRAGLEKTTLLGRSQFLTSKEAEALGVTGATILLDGAHTKGSAKALAYMIQMTFPKARLVLVVAMASDKDHVAFARELLSARQLDGIVLTEISIAGDRSRSTPLSLLKDSWIRASKELGVDIQDFGGAEDSKLLESQSVCSTQELRHKTVLLGEKSLTGSLKLANQVLRKKGGDQSGMIVVTGSLHIVSYVLYSLQP